MSEPREMTAVERKWVARLRRVMKDQPTTLDLATIGDGLHVWCNSKYWELDANGIEVADGGMERHGGELAYITTVNPVHGVSG